ncbi:hypothetical protein NA63_2489 [Flavobacteriaceae bacterium MAR_2010_105]|nr:hypothetical protein NA63_2489 [Flavobacteriaceae bacterium MAR_2010_105]
MKIKKILKISAGVIIFLTLPSLLFFGFVYFKYNEKLPVSSQPEQADILAHKMLDALDHEAFDNTNYIEWVFKKRRYYKWKKNQNHCTVYWKDYKVELDLNDPNSSIVYIHNFSVDGDLAKELIEKAVTYFNNDSFWLVAPYKVFDKGTQRSLVTLDNGELGLLVTYSSGGTTPGDSYLWHLDTSGKPNKFQMWVSMLPIDGLAASWTDWTTTESGAQLPTLHTLLFLGIEITDIKGRE